MTFRITKIFRIYKIFRSPKKLSNKQNGLNTSSPPRGQAGNAKESSLVAKNLENCLKNMKMPSQIFLKVIDKHMKYALIVSYRIVLTQ